jgi:hypothetical protein
MINGQSCELHGDGGTMMASKLTNPLLKLQGACRSTELIVAQLLKKLFTI